MNATLEQVKQYTSIQEKYLDLVKENARANNSLPVRHVWGYTFEVGSRSNTEEFHTVELNGWYDLRGARCDCWANKKQGCCEHVARAYYIVLSWMERREGGRKWAEREQKKVEFARGELLCNCCEVQPIAHIDTDYCIDCAGEYENEHRWTAHL